MTQEDKNLLLKDLCARLPYGVKVYAGEDLAMTLKQIDYKGFCESWENEDFKCHSRWMFPYLRPMSSMTIEEICKIESIIEGGFNYREESLTLNTENVITIPICKMSNLLQFMYQRHLDFNNLISMGLALEAPEGMYNLKEK